MNLDGPSTDQSFTFMPPVPDSPEDLEQRARRLLSDARLVRVAEALNVNPLKAPYEVSCALVTSDGRAYDWSELLLAHVARMDV